MAWTAPPVFIANTTLPAAQMMILADDLNFLANPPSTRIIRSGTQSITNATWTNAAFNGTDSWDTNVMHDSVTNNYRMTAKTAGKYDMFAGIPWAASATGLRGVRFVKDDVTVLHDWMSQAVSAGERLGSIFWRDQVALNSWIAVQVYQTSGGSLSMASGAEAGMTHHGF